MTQEHPITPSEDQIMLWCKQWNCTKEPGPIHKWLAIQAARWGADEQLEMDATWVALQTSNQMSSKRLIAEMRPKPPSLKKLAIAALDEEQADMSTWNYKLIRSVLESLPD